MSKEDLLDAHRELVRLNEIDEGLIYLQITRGSDGDRDFVFPDPETTVPTVVMFTQSKPGLADSPAARRGAKVISIEDIRWGVSIARKGWLEKKDVINTCVPQQLVEQGFCRKWRS